jgi:hypothetical protein
MFGIEISSDILIIAILVQMAIIAILIFTIITKLNKNNPAFTSATKNTELDKKVDKKLTGMQIRLSEILTEVSLATKEQKESISKVSAIVAAAVASSPAANAEVRKPETTAGVSTTTNILPITKDISSLTKMEPFAFATNANASAAALASAITAKPSTFVSDLFDRSDNSPIPKSEFLEIDSDHDSVGDPSKVPDTLSSEITKVSEVVHTSTYGLPYTPATIKSSDSNSNNPPIVLPESRHYFHPQTHNNINRLQHHGEVSSESSSLGENVDDMIRDAKGNNGNNNKGDNSTQNQNYQEVEEETYSEKLDLSTEKNSNPELEKIDKEILTALQRLGGIDNSDANDDKDNDLGSHDKEKTK